MINNDRNYQRMQEQLQQNTPYYANNGNPQGANNMRPPQSELAGLYNRTMPQQNPNYVGGQQRGVGRYRPPTMSGPGGGWQDSGPYNYNLPNAFGSYPGYSQGNPNGMRGGPGLGQMFPQNNQNQMFMEYLRQMMGPNNAGNTRGRPNMGTGGTGGLPGGGSGGQMSFEAFMRDVRPGLTTTMDYRGPEGEAQRDRDLYEFHIRNQQGVGLPSSPGFTGSQPAYRGYDGQGGANAAMPQPAGRNMFDGLRQFMEQMQRGQNNKLPTPDPWQNNKTPTLDPHGADFVPLGSGSRGVTPQPNPNFNPRDIMGTGGVQAPPRKVPLRGRGG